METPDYSFINITQPKLEQTDFEVVLAELAGGGEFDASTLLARLPKFFDYCPDDFDLNLVVSVFENDKTSALSFSSQWFEHICSLVRLAAVSRYRTRAICAPMQLLKMLDVLGGCKVYIDSLDFGEISGLIADFFVSLDNLQLKDGAWGGAFLDVILKHQDWLTGADILNLLIEKSHQPPTPILQKLVDYRDTRELIQGNFRIVRYLGENGCSNILRLHQDTLALWSDPQAGVHDKLTFLSKLHPQHLVLIDKICTHHSSSPSTLIKALFGMNSPVRWCNLALECIPYLRQNPNLHLMALLEYVGISTPASLIPQFDLATAIEGYIGSLNSECHTYMSLVSPTGRGALTDEDALGHKAWVVTEVLIDAVLRGHFTLIESINVYINSHDGDKRSELLKELVPNLNAVLGMFGKKAEFVSEEARMGIVIGRAKFAPPEMPYKYGLETKWRGDVSVFVPDAYSVQACLESIKHAVKLPVGDAIHQPLVGKMGVPLAVAKMNIDKIMGDTVLCSHDGSLRTNLSPFLFERVTLENSTWHYNDGTIVRRIFSQDYVWALHHMLESGDYIGVIEQLRGVEFIIRGAINHPHLNDIILSALALVGRSVQQVALSLSSGAEPSNMRVLEFRRAIKSFLYHIPDRDIGIQDRYTFPSEAVEKAISEVGSNSKDAFVNHILNVLKIKNISGWSVFDLNHRDGVVAHDKGIPFNIGNSFPPNGYHMGNDAEPQDKGQARPLVVMGGAVAGGCENEATASGRVESGSQSDLGASQRPPAYGHDKQTIETAKRLYSFLCRKNSMGAFLGNTLKAPRLCTPELVLAYVAKVGWGNIKFLSSGSMAADDGLSMFEVAGLSKAGKDQRGLLRATVDFEDGMMNAWRAYIELQTNMEAQQNGQPSAVNDFADFANVIALGGDVAKASSPLDSEDNEQAKGLISLLGEEGDLADEGAAQEPKAADAYQIRKTVHLLGKEASLNQSVANALHSYGSQVMAARELIQSDVFDDEKAGIALRTIPRYLEVATPNADTLSMDICLMPLFVNKTDTDEEVYEFYRWLSFAAAKITKGHLSVRHPKDIKVKLELNRD